MKSSKKLLSVFLSVLMLMSAVSVGFVPSAATVCNHNIGENYEDSTMVKYSEIAATCQSTGTANYECTNCYHTESVVLPIDPDNHDFGFWMPVEDNKPGCVTDGEKIRYCECGASETGVMPATGRHTYPDESLLDFWWTAENAGVGTVYEGWTIVKLPTCISTGIAKTVCTECGGAEKTAELHLHSADFKEVTRDEATCTVEGKSYVVCLKCNANYTLAIPTDENNHVLVWETTKEATCSAEGEEALYCQWHKDLGILETRATATKAHSFTNYKYNNNAVCGKDGTKTACCDNCNATDTITAEGTAMVCLKRWKFVKGGNCATGGEAQLTCVYCNTVYENKTFMAGEHLNLVVMTEEPDCENDGYKYYVCDTCEESFNPIPGTEIKSNGHNMKWTEVLAPSCMSKKDGKEFGTCTRCGHTDERTVPYKHNYFDVIPEIPATCDENGATALMQCYDCHIMVDSVKIEAFGHNDADGNGCCDICYEWFIDGPDGNPTSCRCLCHNTDGIAKLFYKIYLFFIKLFGAAQVCDCGAIHYEK